LQKFVHPARDRAICCGNPTEVRRMCNTTTPCAWSQTKKTPWTCLAHGAQCT